MPDMVPKVLLIALLAFFLLACSDDALTPEDEIRQYIERGIAAAEQRSTTKLANMIHSGYSDDKGLDRKRVINMLKLYFLRHKNIHLFKKIQEIHFPTHNEAVVTVHVAMAGTAIASVSMLSSLRARVYTFELQLLRDDGWRLNQANWRPADLSAFQ